MQTLAREFAERAERAPGDVAVIDALGEHTVAEVMQAARDLAVALEESLGGSPTVLVQADNTWRTLATALAVGLRGGMVAVFSSHAVASEFALAMEDVEPDAVIASAGALDHWAVPLEAFPDKRTVLDGWTLLTTGRPASDVARWRGGVAVAMTSGSTGRPKSVVQSEESLRYAGRATIDAIGLEPGDAVGAFVPLSSVAAYCFGMYLPAMLGSPMVSIASWNPDDALEAMAQHDVRWTMLVPTMALQLSVRPSGAGKLSGLRAMTVGGGPMDAGALERAEQFLGTRFIRVFGMSECLGHTTTSPGEDAATRLGCDGRPFPGTEVRAVGDGGRTLPPGEVGAAQVRGPSMFVGYARRGEPQPPELTADGFLPTGDLVRLNPDGTITILGREKQIIIRGGRNIDINEVEAAVARVPGVAQVCVVPVPDEMLGERVAALVVSSGTDLGLADVTGNLEAAGFPKQKWPEFVFSVPDLPQNRVGKLSRPDAVRIAAELAASE
ncbi:class I adenylate-forming enzyme family protein [Nocardioides pocheonensis]|uniref:Long-chain fatty acid--CoA ligase n=1 Tax=Nocardioides pocheonensis TaxID=661485 RepID=A0A3N0GZ55_9ACTN|nr:class I adenylate-forming enzyme family protein [Nocardioides pocheonensis]RNM17430.1 long-chain fatty acid--CoA ligase [Nocardioides pocheonensis]